MKKRRIRHLGTVGVLTAACWTAWVPTATGAGVLGHAQPTGVSTLAAGVFGRAEGGQNGDGERPIGLTDRRRHGGGGNGHGHGGPDTGGGNGRSGSPDGLRKSFDGIDLYDVGVASVGQDALPEKFALEPPDQGLCVGNGKILESVNIALRVYNRNGRPDGPVTDLNTFYGYPRVTQPGAPVLTDPSCLFDPDTQRWFHVVLTIELSPTGDLLGPNHLDIAVSQTPDPSGPWTIYKIPIEHDAAACAEEAGSQTLCLGDYPHIGADANGFYVTSNAFDEPTFSFQGAQIYAFSKRGLVSGRNTSWFHYDTVDGFTVWPAQGNGSQQGDDEDHGDHGDHGKRKSAAVSGVEYFLSANPQPGPDGTEVGNELVVWSLTSTASLDANPPAPPLLRRSSLPVKPYSTPPPSEQRPGNIPLADCLNDPVCRPTLGGHPHPFGPETLGPLDSNDVRIQQVWLAGGRLWAALDSETIVNGSPQAGIEYFIVRPNPDPALSRLEANDYVSLAGTNITFPATAATEANRGVIALTVVGPTTYPSAGYVRLDGSGMAGPVQIAAAGVGPQDGFTEYKAWQDRTFPRWGDYGAAVVDGSTIWMASEYIGQTCRYRVWLRDRTCHKTRVERGNWYTRISAVTP